MTDEFVFYIGSDILNYTNFEDRSIDTYIQKVKPVFDTARQLQADVCYALEDVKLIDDAISTWNDDFTKSKGNQLDLLLENFRSYHQDNFLFKVHFADQNTTIEHFPSPIKSIPVESLTKRHKILISLEAICDLSLLVVKSETEFERIYITTVDSPQKIWEYVNSNLPARTYHFSKKHGNSTTKAVPPNNQEVSQLKCSDSEAQTLLDTAIFDLNEHRWCYNFDNEHDTFIVFPFEGDNPQNQYHAFHLDQTKWGKVPKSILRYFGKPLC